MTLATIIPPQLWKDCKLQAAPTSNAVQTAVCVPADGRPDRWELSTYASAAALHAAYEAELRRNYTGKRNSGTCDQFSWGGEGRWFHGPGKPGGRRFCYFDGNDAVIVWTHQKFGQASHTDILASARKGGSDHPDLFDWWNYWHHRIGKIFT